MTGLVGPNGKPIRSETYGRSTANHKKDAPPVLGEAFGNWAGRDMEYLQLPGGGLVNFDLSKLTLSDFRTMSTHYQVNSSLSVLMFMLHQLDYHIECDNKRIAAHCEANMSNVWTRLVRAMSQAFAFGYSPNILQWENDLNGRSVQLTKIKDLTPEEATPHWKYVDGAIPPGSPEGRRPPKIRIFDGIKVAGNVDPVPTSNAFWYPLLMENGNYFGRKLLKSAFQPWFFSTLMHLFSNRYYERFGEPVPVGRAPFDESVTVNNSEVSARDYMAQALGAIRSRAVAILPSDRAISDSGSPSDKYEYDISYLESQMRGADFERYMTRLDEEISLALFTPLLLMRTADVGSYNLGVSHMQMYLWQLNAIAGDWAEYINKYILAPMANYNFGINSKRPKIVFHKMGKTQAETNRAILAALVNGGKVMPDLTELGQAVGLDLTEIETLVEPNEDTRDNDEGREGRVRDDSGDSTVADRITLRIQPQIEKAWAKGKFEGFQPDFGFTSKIPRDKLNKLIVMNGALNLDTKWESPAEYLNAFNALAHMVLEEEA